jgi:4-amino-4-deoxy-L-arabinose transferase-like glycosyltransferase
MKRRESLTLFTLLAAITLLALPVLTYPLGRDQGEFATIGRGILEGKVLYIDLWNPKPPAVFYVYGAAFRIFGSSPEALRVIDLLLFPAMGAGLYWLGRRLANRRVGLMAAALFGGVYFSQGFWTLTQNDGIALLPMILAAVCAFKVLDSLARSPGWSALCGAACAVALWFKYPFIFFALALGIGHAVSRLRQGDRGLLLKDAAAFLAGGVLVGVIGVAHLAALGAIDAWMESALVTVGYTRQGFDELLTSAVWRDSMERWVTWRQALIVLGWLLVRWQVRRAADGWHVIWLWLLAGPVIVLAQAKGYEYHFLPLLPPLALLGADLIDRLSLWLRRGAAGGLRHVAAAGLPVVVVAWSLAALLIHVWLPSLDYVTGAASRSSYYQRFRGGEFKAAESLEVVEYLRARTTPGDSLYIWGFRPEVYYSSDLRPATRFIFQFPLVGEWYPNAWRQENVDILWAALPPYVLVLRGDYMPWVTGRDEDSYQLLQEYTELNNWLIFNYEQETEIGNFLLWRRRP